MRRYLLLAPALALPVPLAAAGLVVAKSVSVVSDGVSTANPKALPGALIDEQVLVTSPLGNGAATIAGIAVIDTIPDGVKFCLADLGASGSGPVEFTDGSVLGLLGSGLSYRFVSLASAADALDFSGDGTSWAYVPVADASGCDAGVKAVRVRLSGTQAATSGFRLRYRVRVK